MFIHPYKKREKKIQKISLLKDKSNQIKEEVIKKKPALKINVPKISLKIENIRALTKTLVEIATFIFLLILYILSQMVGWLSSRKHFPAFIKNKYGPYFISFYKKAVSVLDNYNSGSISRISLMNLSIRNMKAKKTRTFITIGGMAIGIGSIVFLVSIGYGLQQMVVSRVARLEEMKQADVSVQPGSQVKIDDKTIADFKQIDKVKMALPLVAVVGRVNFNKSISDMAVYGVTRDYLRQSAIKPVKGKIFESNDIVTLSPQNTAEVAGVSTISDGESSISEYGQKIQDIEFSIVPDQWIRVREKPTTKSKILGYTKRLEGKQQGEEFWGTSYISDDGSGNAGKDEDGEDLGKWIKSSVLLWEEKACDKSDGDCEDGMHIVKRDVDNKQVQEIGYFAEVNIVLRGTSPLYEKVLGESTASAELATFIDSSDADFVEIASESGLIEQREAKKVSLGKDAKHEAIVNRAMLKILGINENEAVGKVFDASFIVTGELLEDRNEKLESVPSQYKIIGVVPDDKTPIFYVPFIDLRSIGINNYSQVKVVVENQNELFDVRKKIEGYGYMTQSVTDTVNQINSLFSTARTILAILGMVALGVAALGMFNTLTVSLLERTREVGLMKAMGMKSSELKELFLTESMIMGLCGGVLGLLIGFVAGKALSLILSAFAVVKGVGIIDISHLPLPFTILIIFLSLIVGLVTGIYPARRAMKISALNALRYE